MINGASRFKNGAGKGGTVFVNYQQLKRYLKKDGRRFYVAKILITKNKLDFNFDNKFIATIKISKQSKDGFKRIFV